MGGRTSVCVLNLLRPGLTLRTTYYRDGANNHSLGGLLVGVPFVPGVTDNLLVGLAGAILPFVGRDEAE